MKSRVWPAAALVLGVLSLAGCGRKDRPPMGRVSGVVKYNGEPLAKAAVVFFPDQDGVRSGMGETDDQGRYTLWTYDPADGAPVGSHKVTVTLRGAAEKAEMHPSVIAKGKGEAYYEQVGALGKPLIPEKYFNAMTSGLTATVNSGSNTCNFELSGPALKK